MANPQELLARRVQDGLAVAFGEAYRDTDPLIRPSQHADFQANVALSLGRQLHRPPREVAAELAARPRRWRTSAWRRKSAAAGSST